MSHYLYLLTKMNGADLWAFITVDLVMYRDTASCMQQNYSCVYFGG